MQWGSDVEQVYYSRQGFGKGNVIVVCPWPRQIEVVVVVVVVAAAVSPRYGFSDEDEAIQKKQTG